MSKQQKLKNKGIVPPKLKGAVFNSLHDLGSAMGFKAPEQPTPKEKNCRKCGHPMRQVSGTNIWVCDGMVEKIEGNSKKMIPCGNRAMTSVQPMSQSSGSKPEKTKNHGKTAKAQAATA